MNFMPPTSRSCTLFYQFTLYPKLLDILLKTTKIFTQRTKKKLIICLPPFQVSPHCTRKWTTRCTWTMYKKREKSSWGEVGGSWKGIPLRLLKSNSLFRGVCSRNNKGVMECPFRVAQVVGLCSLGTKMERSEFEGLHNYEVLDVRFASCILDAEMLIWLLSSYFLFVHAIPCASLEEDHVSFSVAN